MVGAIDIGYGATPTVIATNIPFEVASDAGLLAPIILPRSGTIPSGSAIKARLSTAGGSGQTVGVKAIIGPA
jgi:hypothetical protein